MEQVHSASIEIPAGFTARVAENGLDRRLRVSLGVYGVEPVFQAAYKFTDRCFIFMEEDSAAHLIVEFRRRAETVDIDELVGLFANELIDQHLRITVARETRAIRELLYARAFGEARFGESA